MKLRLVSDPSMVLQSALDCAHYVDLVGGLIECWVFVHAQASKGAKQKRERLMSKQDREAERQQSPDGQAGCQGGDLSYYSAHSSWYRCLVAA